MLWVKAFHIIFMVTWFGGIFYLPRLFVYHSMATDQIGIERFKVMERKLFWGIMTPGAILTVFFGLWMLSYNPSYYMSQGWMHAKLGLIALLIFYHIYLGFVLRRFKYDQNQRSHVYYRIINEVPVLLLAAIVILAVVKPF